MPFHPPIFARIFQCSGAIGMTDSRDMRTSAMPSMQTVLTDAEIRDVVAYLSTLK